MVTRSKSKRPQHLYITEWMAERGLTDEKVADQLGVARETVTRYRSFQHRLNPEKIARIAKVLDLEPAQLWRPPNPERPSVDAMLRHATDDTVRRAAEMAEILLKPGGSR